MPYPQHPKKWREKALVDPKHFFDYLQSQGRAPAHVPPSIIVGWSSRLRTYVRNRYKVGEPPQKRPYSGLTIPGTNGRVGFTGDFGIGAPATVTWVEELLALGARQVIGIGIAGSLREELPAGSMVVCTKALRDEGTSHHYLPYSRYAFPSTTLTRQIAKALRADGLPFVEGPSWTVDAPYRETVAEIRRWRKEGILTVEMEISALFSLAKYRRARAAAVFVISDVVHEDGWRPQFHDAREGLVAAFEAVKRALAKQ
jgi:uridine phosphorylase